MPKYKIGIDPGVTGAVCVIEVATNKIVLLSDLPVVANGKGSSTVKNMIEPVALQSLLTPFSTDSVAHVERVASRPGNGVASIFSLGDSAGCIRAVLACLGIPLVYFSPAVWKKTYNIETGADKDISRSLALQLFPKADITRKKDHNRAEAILIANLNTK